MRAPLSAHLHRVPDAGSRFPGRWPPSRPPVDSERRTAASLRPSRLRRSPRNVQAAFSRILGLVAHAAWWLGYQTQPSGGLGAARRLSGLSAGQDPPSARVHFQPLTADPGEARPSQPVS